MECKSTTALDISFLVTNGAAGKFGPVLWGTSYDEFGQVNGWPY